MNPLVKGITQDYILVGEEMIQLPVTASNSKKLIIGLYYAKASKRLLEPTEAKFLIPIVNEEQGTFAYGEIADASEFNKDNFIELIKVVSKNTDPGIEDAAFEFSTTKNNIGYAYESFSLKIAEINELEEDHPNFIYDFALVDWHKRRYIEVHLPDTVLVFKYYESGVLSVYNTQTKEYIYEKRCHAVDFIFNTDFIKSNFYSTEFDLRSFSTGVRDFQRFQYAIMESVIQPSIRFASSLDRFTGTFLINNKKAVIYSLDKDYTVFYRNLYFPKPTNDDSSFNAFKMKNLTVIGNEYNDDTDITHNIYHIDLVSTDYKEAKYIMTKFNTSDDSPTDANDLFPATDLEDDSIIYNTDKNFSFLINRLSRYYFYSGMTFRDDNPHDQNLVPDIPLRTDIPR